MAFSMVIAQSLVARTFGTYVLQLFETAPADLLVPRLGIALLAITFSVNITGNRFIQGFSSALSFAKIPGILVFCVAALSIFGIFGGEFLFLLYRRKKEKS